MRSAELSYKSTAFIIFIVDLVVVITVTGYCRIWVVDIMLSDSSAVTVVSEGAILVLTTRLTCRTSANPCQFSVGPIPRLSVIIYGTM